MHLYLDVVKALGYTEQGQRIDYIFLLHISDIISVLCACPACVSAASKRWTTTVPGWTTASERTTRNTLCFSRWDTNVTAHKIRSWSLTVHSVKTQNPVEHRTLNNCKLHSWKTKICSFCRILTFKTPKNYISIHVVVLQTLIIIMFIIIQHFYSGMEMFGQHWSTFLVKFEQLGHEWIPKMGTQHPAEQWQPWEIWTLRWLCYPDVC